MSLINKCLSRHIWRFPGDIHLIIFIQSTNLFSIYFAQILYQVLETKIKQIISKSSRSEGQLVRYNIQFGNYIEVHCVIIGEQKRAPNPVAGIYEEQRKFARECFLQLCMSPTLKSKQELAKDKGFCLVSLMSDTFASSPTVACQAPLPMGFPRQDYWSGLPCPPPGDFLAQGSNPCLCDSCISR